MTPEKPAWQQAGFFMGVVLAAARGGALSSGGSAAQAPLRKACPPFSDPDSRNRHSMARCDRSEGAKFLHFHKPSTRKVSDPTFHVAEVRLKHC
jgi:hypothetical protein